MGSTREELNKLSLSEIKKLAADRRLRTSGLKSKIIDDIIKYDDSKRVIKSRKIVDNKKSISRELESSTIYQIPLDVKKEAALS